MLSGQPSRNVMVVRSENLLHSEMPPKVRELIAQLVSAGFVDRGGRGSHRNFVHPKVRKPVTLSGNPGHDAMPYQIQAVRRAIERSRR